ncbi:unnamed protein product [Eruca vesicaria subsp. sativa]|uniref:Probable zinc-ribbon domain-containing protein n=1 Tax=Eruca vesicaria subsp. sativa TaxID=29727 RepID=A0ABC8KUQ1_ERUVS|nr:unnamed protein product [Eruca vesicaria subsp. sativa]
MRSRGDDVDDVRSDAGSSKETTSLQGKHTTNGSQRSGKSQDLGSESPSKNTNTNNPIEYTEQERAELLRRLDSIKDHLLRGGNKPKETDHTQPFLRPIHLHAPPPYPYPHYPQGYHHHQDPYRRPPPFPNPYGPYPNHMTGGADVVDSHPYFPATPSRYSDMPPYSPLSSHQRLYSPPGNTYNNSPSFPSSMNSPGPRGGGGGGYARWPSGLDSEMGGGGAFARGYVKKAVSDSDARRCHPLAGGAPFIACRSCFELLYLPKKKLLAQEGRQHKLQCGACSEVITFTIVDKKLVFTTTEPVSLVVEARTTTNQELKNQGDTTKTTRSESQHSDDEERSSVSSEQQQKEVKSVPRRVKGSKSPEPAGAPESASLLELFEYSNVNRAALAYGMAELGYTKPYKQEVFKKQDSVKAESVATETEVSYNGYSNTEITEDSTCSTGREEDKNGTRNRNEDQGKSLEVWVNGHLIPENLVSSAEKLAGPIQTGKYWYDYRAGFWGVMGKPCLGIIPPFIEEFSHPMPDRCAAGNTEVYVNGRELHKRDLELLVGRGLPRDKNRSYILDISGRVLDGDSGEELKSLGRLAPTIEKTKHGFGMRVPRSLAS